ncbi:TonB-dependent receptor [Mucilaginibacter lappiensis]|uniref:TonB-dependent receptor n=1 Tax=Mucilaginibacter lappiensis TaxID=354630 RepID=A0A841JDJ0_9SPHI|nr:TonB-dependent receptor [Mucilaginibacter lappiensis]MBB6129213.1 TonB-dependent receptor [Mucilaginibacter lappiensis]
MNKYLQTLLFLLLCVTAANATKLKGHVYDRKTGEPMVGATVSLDKTNKATTTGLDGSFELKDVPKGTFNLRVSYVMYQTVLQEVDIEKEDNPHLKIYLEEAGKALQEVTVSTKKNAASENTARRLEQQSTQVMNVVSGRAIEISPDLTVANVIARVSGVSVERNSNGDGQYAILRGMDKRYNYTLVNGVKIPSPDNKYRYVPLDIFPADLLDRLEVYKTLTPNMEGDAVGGAVNMVMKDAPDRLQINANIAGGYSQLFIDRKFMSYDYSGINYKSPSEINGKAYQATQNDFSKGTLSYALKHPAPNVVGTLTLGQRFFDNKLGVLVAGSYQNTYRGSNSIFYSSKVVPTAQYAAVTSKSDREYSEQQKRYGLFSKVDYVMDKRNKLSLFNTYVNLTNIQVRDEVSTNFSTDYDPDKGNAQLGYSTRSRLTKQQIYNGMLRGDHQLFNDKLKVQWSAVYSSAENEVPDNTTISLNGVRENFVDRRTLLTNGTPLTHRWERNTDEDKAGYLDLTYTTPVAGVNVDFSAGGLYRDKQRSSFYNNYALTPVNPGAVYGTDFQNYTDLSFTVTNPGGAVNNPLTYDASEKIGAGYGMFKFTTKAVQVVGGARVEHTDQGYRMLFPAGETRPTGNQIYTDVLPSLTIKYFLTDKQQLHASYFRSLNRPGFYEIVPSKVVNEEYQERGNPDLKRAIADNYDLRYELFPDAGTQLLAGAFYKNIKNPIEYIFQADATRGQDTYYTPGNFGTAHNYGLELDFIKFFNKIGVKANYTYTHSRITTPKDTYVTDANGDTRKISVNQSRPLYGQSEHIANVSLLYKDTKKGWDAQIAGAYTGPRINTVSQFLNNDLWQQGFIQMDVSAEKRFKNGLSVFVKGGNLLNTPSKLFIKGTNPANAALKDDNIESNGHTLIRSDYYKQTYLIGVRYKL